MIEEINCLFCGRKIKIAWKKEETITTFLTEWRVKDGYAYCEHCVRQYFLQLWLNDKERKLQFKLYVMF